MATLIVFASPANASSEQEWLDWYSATHIPELRAAIPEVGTVTQHKLLGPPDRLPRYATIYEAIGIDAPTLASRLGAAAPTLSQTELMAVGDDAPALHFADPLQ